MKITLNNREEVFDKAQLTIAEIIKLKNFTFRLLVTKHNGRVVKTHERNQVVVCEGDKVDVIHMISGG